MVSHHKKQEADKNILAENRKAFFSYEILEKLECGVALTGPEVKSAKARQINIKPGYASIEKGQVILKGTHIAPYKQSTDFMYNPDRYRQLLLHKKEITWLEKQQDLQGLTLIPLQVHLKKGKIKILIGLCKGKQLHDKRESLKKKAQNLEIKRALKRY